MDHKQDQHPSFTTGAAPKHNLVCEYCGRKFTIVQNLKRHMRNQHLGYRYPCASCDAEVTRREDIIKHYNAYHPDKMAEVNNIREVCKLTDEGKILPLGRVFEKKPRRRRAYRPVGDQRSNPSKWQSKHEKPSDTHKLDTQSNIADFLHMTNSNVLDSQTVQTSPPGEAEDSCGSEPQRVIIALDPVTQFRLERVIAERVHKIIEKSVVETLDMSGRVTRRETIEREYLLSNVENRK